jgi:hypothetical protein
LVCGFLALPPPPPTPSPQIGACAGGSGGVQRHPLPHHEAHTQFVCATVALFVAHYRVPVYYSMRARLVGVTNENAQGRQGRGKGVGWGLAEKSVHD